MAVARPFVYFCPNTESEALALLRDYKGEAKILAGGMSLIPLMKLRLVSPNYIIDINRIESLSYIKQDGEKIRIGALTRHHDLERSELIKKILPILSETAFWVGDPQVRNMGTIGGSLSHADPAGDLGSCIIVLRGELVIKSEKGERTVSIDNFFVDTFTTVLQSDEMLKEIFINIPKDRSGGAYLKLERRAGDFAIAAVATQISIDPKGICSYAGIGLTAVGSTNLRVKKAEEFLLGKELNDKVIEEAAEIAASEAKPTDDPLRGSAEYKRAMVKVLTKRALKISLNRARGG
jgi:carbon-monoxide dehydrogenase medium subunit